MVCVSVITLCVCVQIALLLCGFAVKVQIPAAVRRGSKLRGRIALDEMRNVLSAVGPTNCLVRLSPLALALCDRYIECCAFKSCQLYIFFLYEQLFGLRRDRVVARSGWVGFLWQLHFTVTSPFFFFFWYRSGPWTAKYVPMRPFFAAEEENTSGNPILEANKSCTRAKLPSHNSVLRRTEQKKKKMKERNM